MVTTLDFGDNGLTVDGTFIGFPLTTAKTREVFGEPRLTAGKDHAVQTWDALGIKTFGPLDGTLVSILDVFPAGRDNDNYAYNPTSGFPGQLSVNGVHIDAVAFQPGFAADKLYLPIGPYMLSRALDRPGGGFYDFFIQRTDVDYFSRADGVAEAVQNLVISWRQALAPTHVVDLSAAGVTIDETLVTLPTTPAVLTSLLGEPREVPSVSDDAVDWLWDSLGLRASGLRGTVAAFAVVDGVGDSAAPRTAATGIRLTVGDADPTSVIWDATTTFAREKTLGSNVLTRGAYPGDVYWELATTREVVAVAAASSIAEPAVVERVEAPSGEVKSTVPVTAAVAPAPVRGRAKNNYTLKPLVEPVLSFADFGVKLQVIEELMFRQSKLKPRFELEDFANWFPDRLIDAATETDIPEVRAYFEALPIPSRFAYDVKSLTAAPDAAVLHELRATSPVPLSSLDDLAQLPYLKKVVLAFSQDASGVQALEARGVTVEKPSLPD
ncbi:hypothetical protein EYE40_03210 [Glaciihabitans arcticus]|uniref:Uncharacterized protein n=1 Tax=Glaciihabitans arcticus TaxID=2668039 RepID=A0A4Q9GTM7_9MICO|nr:hypothetical protein [Glaciihabitans arcticus]TBN56487.1 hypothetical protein EYE40_03210 [Glaciihabitans arcticus]